MKVEKDLESLKAAKSDGLRDHLICPIQASILLYWRNYKIRICTQAGSDRALARTAVI